MEVVAVASSELERDTISDRAALAQR